MREVNVTLASVHPAALDAALRVALPDKVFGLSVYGPDRLLSIWLDDSATEPDKTTASSIAAAHDPVFLSIDKTQIIADGIDKATITVTALPSGAPVVLLVAGALVNVVLVNGVGTVTVTSIDPATTPISVQNPTNRTADSFVVEAS